MKIRIPTSCPSCGSELNLVGPQLYCTNKVDCPAQTGKKIENFAKTLKIKGLGPKTVEKLEISSIPEIYELEEEYLVAVLGEKTGKKLYEEISLSKQCDFVTFLSALGIPLVGKTAAQTLADGFDNLTDLHNNLQAKSKAALNLKTWLDENIITYSNLPIIFSSKQAEARNLGKVCITGKLQNFKSRDEAATLLESLGYKVVSSVTKDTQYLVCEESKESSKLKKALDLGIQIVTIQQLTKD